MILEPGDVISVIVVTLEDKTRMPRYSRSGDTVQMIVIYVSFTGYGSNEKVDCYHALYQYGDKWYIEYLFMPRFRELVSYVRSMSLEELLTHERESVREIGQRRQKS